jgi:hypothetical protein
VIPVEVTQTPWHYTNFWDWLDHWQTLIAGGFALLAAIIAVLVTIRIESWKVRAEEKEALIKEIRVTNTVTTITFGITNTLLSAKKELIKPLKKMFDENRELTSSSNRKYWNTYLLISDQSL